MNKTTKIILTFLIVISSFSGWCTGISKTMSMATDTIYGYATTCENDGYHEYGYNFSYLSPGLKILDTTYNDTTYHIFLNVLRVKHNNYTRKICPDELPFTSEDGLFYIENQDIEEKSYDTILQSQASNGCDSIVTLTLKLYHDGDTTIQATVCYNDQPYYS